MKFSRVLGSLRILKAAVIFPITTFATCVACAKCVDFWPTNPWTLQYSWVAGLGMPVIAFFTANSACRSFGEVGAFGKDPVADFRDVFRRIFVKHIFACLGFLAPHVAVSMFHQLTLWVLFVCLPFLRLCCVDSFLAEVINDRVRYTNLNKFKEGIGARRTRRPNKGIRRK